MSDKDNTGRRDRESNPPGGGGGPEVPPGNPPTGGSGEGTGRSFDARKRQYLIAPRNVPGVLQPMSADAVHDALNNMEGVKVVKRIKPQSFSALAAGMPSASVPEVVVVETEVERGENIRVNAPAHLIVEHNALLKHADEVPDPFMLARSSLEAGLLPAQRIAIDLSFQVVGENNVPLPNALVTVYGSAFPAQVTTDANGKVVVSVFGGPVESIQAVYVKPEANYWEKFVSRPELSSAGVNIMTLRSLSQTFQNFPKTGLVGWGQRLMNLDKAGKEFSGHGVKIGIIDSGCDNSHPQLTHVKKGLDLTNNRNANTWATDTVAHGTHCAGIISGKSGVVEGIRGFAPEAEVHAFKVFPGGRFDSLLEALDECITRGIDVVNLSLGSDQVSEIVAQKIEEARRSGVACIVAAGNSAGPVQFPGNLPNVLTVSAVGKAGEFPADTYHALTTLPGVASVDGVFAAKFSCFGPQIDVSGPGVAIVSCIPGNGYAAWDGTSMATPHITGLAALLLAHHPVFKSQLAHRSEQRVAALFQLLKSAAVPYVADFSRGGAGIPDVSRVFGAAQAVQPNNASLGGASLGGAFGNAGLGQQQGGPFSSGAPGAAGLGAGMPMGMPSSFPAAASPQAAALGLFSNAPAGTFGTGLPGAVGAGASSGQSLGGVGVISAPSGIGGGDGVYGRGPVPDQNTLIAAAIMSNPAALQALLQMRMLGLIA